MNFSKEITKILQILTFTISLLVGLLVIECLLVSCSYALKSLGLIDFLVSITWTTTLIGLLWGTAITLVVYLLYHYRYRRLFISLVKVAGDSTLKKAELFLECAKTFDVRINANFRMNSRTVVHLDNIQRIDFKIFYEAFFTEIERIIRLPGSKDAYDNIFSAISDIQSVENRYEKQFDIFITRYNYLEEKRNAAIRGMQITLQALFEGVHGKTDVLPAFDAYLREIVNIQNNWKQAGGITLPSVFDELYIQEIRRLNESYVNDVRVMNRIPNDLVHYLNDADNEYKSLKNLVNTQHDIFFGYFKAYRKHSETMLKSAELLSKSRAGSISRFLSLGIESVVNFPEPEYMEETSPEMTLKEANNIIEGFKVFKAKKDHTSYSIVKNFLRRWEIKVPSKILPKGTLLYRCRKHFCDHPSVFENIIDISYRRDILCIYNFGRANEPVQSIFYCSDNFELAIKEISSFCSGNLQTNEEIVTIGTWQVQKDIDIGNLIVKKFDNSIHESNPAVKVMYNEFIEAMKRHPKVKAEIYTTFLSFFADEYLVKTPTSGEYLITAAFANYYYEELGCAFAYPSVQNTTQIDPLCSV